MLSPGQACFMRSEYEREQAGQVRNISTLTVYVSEEERLEGLRLIYTVGVEMETSLPRIFSGKNLSVQEK